MEGTTKAVTEEIKMRLEHSGGNNVLICCTQASVDVSVFIKAIGNKHSFRIKKEIIKEIIKTEV